MLPRGLLGRHHVPRVLLSVWPIHLAIFLTTTKLCRPNAYRTQLSPAPVFGLDRQTNTGSSMERLFSAWTLKQILVHLWSACFRP
jgi:hypothetical protein